ncbi:MAG: family 16 glycosylhydrolase [Caldithrix sp.]|nr:family 16 glycosylhydrolase [Caldithrix sp.]
MKTTSSGPWFLPLLLLLFMMLGLFGCQSSTDKSAQEGNSTIDAPAGWELLWHDEFNGKQLDTSKWVHETGGHGWGNNELQYYTNRENNAYVDSGLLKIKAVKESYKDRQYTSARLNSKKGWVYSRIEVKAKLPSGKGTWPAIWMLPDEWNYGDGGWPDNGEIDIMEHVGYEPHKIYGSIHCHDFNHILGTNKTGEITRRDVEDTFHVYALDWYPDRLDFWLDDSLYFRYAKPSDQWQQWPFDRPFHLLINIAVGGNWGGAQGVDDTIFPAEMHIDYVRVFGKQP